MLDVVILVSALAMAVYHFAYAQLLIQGCALNANTHLGFALVIIFLTALRDTRKRWVLWLLLALAAIVCIAYVQVFYLDLAFRISDNTYLDIAIGITLIIVCLIACVRAVGIILPAIAGLFIAYCFFGYLLPGLLHSQQMPWELIVSRLSLSFGIAGIYGYLLSISATYVFLFMIFAGLISATGAVEFFAGIGNLISHRFRAGPAMAAVVTSGMVGSVTGIPGPNVMITGSFTIPAMKRVGYTAEQAGGIESASSTSGVIIPPVMGVAAFIMVGFTGIAYKDICIAAFVPALFYLVSAGCYTIFQAGRMKITTTTVKVDKRELMLRAPLFIIPLLVIIVLLLMDYSPMIASFWACIALIIMSLIRPKARPSLSGYLEGFRNGAEMGAKVGTICATLGMVIVTMTMTGLGIRLPGIVATVAGDNLLLLLVLTWAACILLGCGLPGSAAYLLVAITCAPILVKIGIPLLQAHLFVLFASTFANITPPVAISAMIAAQLAGGSYMKTAVQAAMVGIAGFVLPFMIIFSPSLVLDFPEPLLAATSLIACPLIFLGLQASFVGYFTKRLNSVERTIILLSPIALMLHIYTANFVWFAVGLAILVVFILWQIRITRRESQKLSIEGATT